MSKTTQPKVTLVGAGPGDPELITLAGVKALQAADVILYDALVNKEILDWAPQAKKIFVGKRLGYKRYKQEEINYMLVSKAMQYGHVVRLKGGDAFIFGRGSEELDHVQSFDIETKVIPGISSVTAAGANLGLPLTKRGISEGFWVMTGTTQYHQLTKDLKLAAQSKSTVVILMGTAKLKEIVAVYKQLGKQDEKIALIQHATLREERSVIGTMRTIVEQVAKQQIANPAVIVIGNVVGETMDYKLEEILKHVNYE